MESFTINSSQIIYRNNDKIQLIPKNKEIDNIKLEQKLFEIKAKNDKFYFCPNIQIIKDNNLQGMINSSWLLYQGKNYPKSQNKYRLSEGDIIKIGRIMFIIREIQIKQSLTMNKNSITNNFSEDFNDSNNINIINNEILKYNTIENENLTTKKLNIRKINTLDYHKLKKQNEKEKKKHDPIFERKIMRIQENQNLISNSNTMTLSISHFSENKIKEKENDKLTLNLSKSFKNIKKKIKKKKLCRICYLEEEESNIENPLIQPCQCSGSLKYIHLNCLLHWLSTKILIKKTFFSGKNYFTVFTINKIECELCKEKLPDYIMHEGKIYSLIDFDQHDKEIENNYITFDAYSADKKQNRYRYIIKFDECNSLMIGRGVEANIILNDISISRQHCNLFINNKGEIFLSDLQSKFGTLVLIQNPCLEILKGDILSVQIGRSYFTFEYKKSFSLFGCCDANDNNKNSTYEKLNRKFVYLHNFSNIKEEKPNCNDDSSDSDIDDNINLNEKNGFLKIIDEENANKNLSGDNENDLTMQMNGEITNKGNQEIIFSQTKNNNNHSNNINNNDN